MSLEHLSVDTLFQLIAFLLALVYFGGGLLWRLIAPVLGIFASVLRAVGGSR
jgi:hypothetical protein